MSLSKTIFSSKEESTQANARNERGTPSTDAEQILHLKQLLVTLKKQYEKGLHDLNAQLYAEQKKNQDLANKLNSATVGHHSTEELSDEINALRKQILNLREAAKHRVSDSPQAVEEGRQRIEQLERVIPYLRERTHEANLEAEHLREHLAEIQKKRYELEQEWQAKHQEAQKEIHRLSESFARQLELTEKSIPSSHISEERYLEVVNQKIAAEYKVEQQLVAVNSMTEKLQELERDKKAFEAQLYDKSNALKDELSEKNRLQCKIEELKSNLAEQASQDSAKLQELDQLKHALESQLEEKSRLNHELQHQSNYQHGQIQSLKEQLQHLDHDKHALDQLLLKKQSLFEELLGEKDHLHSEIHKLHGSLEQHVQQIHTLKNRLEGVEHQKTHLEQALKEHEDRFAQLLREKQQCESDLKHFQSITEQDNRRIHSLQEQTTHLHQDKQSLEAALQNKNTHYDYLNKEKEQLENYLKQVRSDLEQQSSLLHKLKEQIQQLDQHKYSLEAELHNKSGQFQELSFEKDLLEAGFKQLKEEKYALESLLRDKDEQIENLINEKGTLNGQILNLEALSAQHEKQNQSVQDQFKQVKSDQYLLETFLSQKDMEIHNLQLNRIEQEAQVTDLQQISVQQVITINDLKGQLLSIESENQHLAKQLDGQAEQYHELLEDKTNLEQQICHFNQLTIGNQDQIESLQRIVNNLEKDRSYLDILLKDKNGQYDALLAKHQLLEAHLKNLDESSELQLTQLHTLQDRLAHVDEQKQDLESLLSAKTRVYQELVKEYENLEQENIQQCVNLEQSKLVIDTLQEQINTLEADKLRLEGIQKDCLHLEAELDQKLENMTELAFKLQERDEQLHKSQIINDELQSRLSRLELIRQDKASLEEKYESLQTEKKQLGADLQLVHNRHQEAERRVRELEDRLHEHRSLVEEKLHIIHQCQLEKESFQNDLTACQADLEESEQNFKVAQQHLAKKVKEFTLVNEKLQQQQYALNEYARAVEGYKVQIKQLSGSLEQHQNQELRVQNELREALNKAEFQISKWEEKYYSVYDKLQDSENRIRELQKIEEKHQQMQGILANLGSYMTTGPSSITHQSPIRETGSQRPPTATVFEMGHSSTLLEDQNDTSNGNFDIFGMQINKPKS